MLPLSSFLLLLHELHVPYSSPSTSHSTSQCWQQRTHWHRLWWALHSHLWVHAQHAEGFGLSMIHEEGWALPSDLTSTNWGQWTSGDRLTQDLLSFIKKLWSHHLRDLVLGCRVRRYPDSWRECSHGMRVRTDHTHSPEDRWPCYSHKY